jgi:hypothetical protein
VRESTGGPPHSVPRPTGQAPSSSNFFLSRAFFELDFFFWQSRSNLFTHARARTRSHAIEWAGPPPPLVPPISGRPVGAADLHLLYLLRPPDPAGGGAWSHLAARLVLNRVARAKGAGLNEGAGVVNVPTIKWGGGGAH